VKNRVKELRARYDWTQEDLARRTGITRQTVGLIEKGDYSPSVLLALKMAHVFGVPVEEVFQLETHEYPEGGGPVT
jgi:Predicted transcriptional regulators